MNTPLRLLTFPLLALTCGACSDYRTQTDSWWLRYHPEKNEAILVEVQDGVTGGDDAGEALGKLVAGWRRYPPEGGLLTLDLDEEIDWSEVDAPTDVEELKRIYEGLERSVEVTDVGLFRAGEDGLGFYRVTHIKDLSLLLEGMNILVNAFLADTLEGRDFGDEGDFAISEETKALWLERVEKNQAWITLDGSALVIDVPMTETEAGTFLRTVLADPGDDEVPEWFIDAIQSLRIADGALRLTIAPDGLRFHSTSTNEDYEPSSGHAELIEALGQKPGFAEFDRSAVLERVK
jgi:hypothetical protein